MVITGWQESRRRRREGGEVVGTCRAIVETETIVASRRRAVERCLLKIRQRDAAPYGAGQLIEPLRALLAAMSSAPGGIDAAGEARLRPVVATRAAQCSTA